MSEREEKVIKYIGGFIGWAINMALTAWLVSVFIGKAHAAPAPCMGYFADVFRQTAVKRIEALASTQGDVTLFIGDSITQMWTDDAFSGFSVPPKCGISTNSGLVDWTGIPSVKVNLGLSGIQTCPALVEYQNTFKAKLQPFAQRVKAVVINLGTNDVIQMSKTQQLPSTQVQYIKQMIDEMGAQLPNAKFLVYNIPPCLSSFCGAATDRANRVSGFNSALSALNGYSGKTLYLQVPLKASDMTIDQIHINSCGYRKMAHSIRFALVAWGVWNGIGSKPDCMSFTPVHPCDL